MKKLKQLDKVRAKFMPKRTDDLKPGVEEMIGTEHIFQAYFIIDEGEYIGQFAMMPMSNGLFFWVPEGDLEILEYLK